MWGGGRFGLSAVFETTESIFKIQKLRSVASIDPIEPVLDRRRKQSRDPISLTSVQPLTSQVRPKESILNVYNPSGKCAILTVDRQFTVNRLWKIVRRSHIRLSTSDLGGGNQPPVVFGTPVHNICGNVVKISDPGRSTSGHQLTAHVRWPHLRKVRMLVIATPTECSP